ncbi:MAG: DUF4621 domain-containing protein [Tannerellaceae bacterium]|jgi:hypothetical protein|nr:DUF4621 domain-containing protein [Tannerellaceae bacterium]
MYKCLNCLLAGCLLTLPLACVDEAYDLGNIDTDNITIGDNVSGSLGTKSFSLGDFLFDTSSESLKTDDEGNYYVFFEEKKILKAGTHPTVLGKQYGSSEEDVDNWQYPLPQTDNFTRVAKGSSDPIIFDLSKEIKVLDSMFLRTGTLKINFWLTNFKANDNKSEIKLSVTLPAGCFLKDGKTTKDSTYVVSKLKNYQGSISLDLGRIIPKENNGIQCSFSLTIPKGANVSVSNTPPRFKAETSLEKVEYEVLYGKFATTMDIEETVINFEEFDDLFEDEDATLSFADPHIELIDTQKIGIPILVDMDIANDQESVHIPGLKIAPPVAYSPDAKKVNKIWIGATDPKKDDFFFEENKEVVDILGIVPELLTIHGKASSDSTTTGFYTSPQPDQELIFAVKVPLEPAEDFNLTSLETLDGVFDEDLIEILFSNGTIELSGEVINDLPLDIELNLDIIDAKGSSIGINWEKQSVKALSKAEVSFLISEKDMPKLKDKKADGILISFTAIGSKNPKVKGVCLNKEQTIDLKLKFKKKGGIVLRDL